MPRRVVLKELPLQHSEQYSELSYDSSHQYSSILVCPECGATYMYVTFEVFDDGWSYWAPISRAQILEFSTKVKEYDCFPDAVEFIEQSPIHFIKHPVHGISMSEGNATILWGLPPW